MAFVNPMNVSVGNPGATGKPYIVTSNQNTDNMWGSQPPKGKQWSANPAQTTAPAQQTYGPNAVRASGTGPFDNTYRQNLATYAGGLFQNQGTSFLNPTGNIGGQATTGGNAPATGMPNTWLTSAFNNPMQSQAPQPSTTQSSMPPTFSQWLQQFINPTGGNVGNL